MTPDHSDESEESWESWVGRIAADLAALTVGGFATYAAGATAVSCCDSPPPTRGWWRRRRASRMPAASGPLPPSEVLLQAQVLEGVLALECIGDTEFEGLSHLSTGQQRRLVELGWDQDGRDPTFSQTYSLEESGAAADLLARSLREVLGAARPSQVETRHA